MADEVNGKPGETGGERPEEQDYVQMIMDRHKPLKERGGGAIARAIVVPIVIILIILAVVWVVLVHAGDSYRSATFTEVFRQARKPLVEQNAIQKLFTPNYDHLKSLAVPQVLYAGRSDMVLPGGYRVRLEGVTDLRDHFRRARELRSAPVFKLSCHDRRIHVDRLMIVDEIGLADTEMTFVEKIDLLDRMPDRSTKNELGKIRRAPQFAYDDENTFKKFVGSTIAVAGKPRRDEDRWVLEGNNWKMVLLFPPEAQSLTTILELAIQSDEPLMVDVVLNKTYPWTNRRNLQESRKETQIIGEGTMVSASLQGLHVGLSAEEQS